MRRFLASVLYLLFGLPLVLSGLLALSVRPWALDPGYYKGAISDERLWTALRSPEALRGVPDRIELQGRSLSGPAFAAAIQKHLPESEAKALVARTAEAWAADFAAGRAPGPIDLVPLKARLSADSAAIAADYFRALPEATGAALPTDLAVRTKALPEARFEKAVDGLLETSIATIPDNPRPEPTALPRSTLSGRLETGKAALDRLATTGSAAAGLLLLGLGFLGGGGLARSLSRAGKFIALPSAIVLAVGVLLSIPGAPLVTTLLPHSGAVVESGFFQSIRGWIGSWLGVAARSFFIVGLSGVSIGGFLASLRRIVEPREY